MTEGRIERLAYASLTFVLAAAAAARLLVGATRVGGCDFCGIDGGLLLVVGVMVLAAGVWSARRVGRGGVGRVGGVLLGLAVMAVGVLGLLFTFSWHFDPLSGADVAVLSALLIVLGLVVALRVGLFRVGQEGGAAGASPPPMWLVAEPGASAARFIMGEERAGFLEAGTLVKEVRRTGSRVLVIDPDGVTGWVDGDRLEPTVQPTDTGERER